MNAGSMTFTARVLSVTALLAATSLLDAQQQTLNILPGAAEIDGFAGAHFSSTLNLSNPTGSPATLTIGLIPQPGKPAPAPVNRSLLPGESQQIPTVLTALFGLTADAGALTITGDAAVIATLSTLNVADPLGTYGVAFAPVPESGLLVAGQSAMPSG